MLTCEHAHTRTYLHLLVMEPTVSKSKPTLLSMHLGERISSSPRDAQRSQYLEEKEREEEEESRRKLQKSNSWRAEFEASLKEATPALRLILK